MVKYNVDGNFHVYLRDMGNDEIEEIPLTSCSISEEDLRIKSAKISTYKEIDLSTEMTWVYITYMNITVYSGILLSGDYDESKGIYSYQSLGHQRWLTSKTWFVHNPKEGDSNDLYKAIEEMIEKIKADTSIAGVDIYPKSKYTPYPNLLTKDNSDGWKVTEGLFYEDKTYYEILMSLVAKSSCAIDCYVDENNILHLTPIDIDSWKNKDTIKFTTSDLSKYTYQSDATDIITGVYIKSKDIYKQYEVNKPDFYSSKDMIGIDLTMYYGKMETFETGETKKVTTTEDEETTDDEGNITTETKTTEKDVADVEANEKKARSKITSSVRDLMSFTIETDKYLPNLHTNMFIWFEIPKKHTLANYSKFVAKIDETTVRGGQFTLNRFYVEKIDIDYGTDGIKTKITLNPFASDMSEYSKAYEDAKSAYEQANCSNESENTGESVGTSSGKSSTPPANCGTITVTQMPSTTGSMPPYSYKKYTKTWKNWCLAYETKLLVRKKINNIYQYQKIPIGFMFDRGINKNDNYEIRSFNTETKQMEWKRINQVQRNPIRPLYKSTFTNGSSIITTKYHKFYNDELVKEKAIDNKKCYIIDNINDCKYLIGDLKDINVSDEYKGYLHNELVDYINSTPYQTLNYDEALLILKELLIIGGIFDRGKVGFITTDDKLIELFNTCCEICGYRTGGVAYIDDIYYQTFIDDSERTYVRKISFEYVKTDYTYNINVKDNHNYFVNNLLISNCPVCGKAGTLTDNPKGVYEGEITCSMKKGGCDSDWDGVTGKNKAGNCPNPGCKYNWTFLVDKNGNRNSKGNISLSVGGANGSSSGASGSSGTSTECVSGGSGSLGGSYSVSSAVSNLANKVINDTSSESNACKSSLRLRYNYIQYHSYNNFIRSPEQVISRGGGNCCDGTRLQLNMLAYKGVTTSKLKYVHAPGHVYGKYNNQIMDWVKSTNGWGNCWGSKSVLKTTTFPTTPFGNSKYAILTDFFYGCNKQLTLEEDNFIEENTDILFDLMKNFIPLESYPPIKNFIENGYTSCEEYLIENENYCEIPFEEMEEYLND